MRVVQPVISSAPVLLDFAPRVVRVDQADGLPQFKEGWKVAKAEAQHLPGV